MPCIAYEDRKFSADSLARIEQANEIITEYQAQGFDLTLRQLYYQFVARDLLPNTQKAYNNLGSLVNNARLAGLIDWDAIQDRTRNLRSYNYWDSPGEIVSDAARQYERDKWAGQAYRPEVWIEKDALIGVIEGVCQRLDVPYFSCRGYTSQSEMWRAAQRLQAYVLAGQTPVILHLGDHDPSGIDMSRDIRERLDLFIMGERRDAEEIEQEPSIIFKRIALNMNQIEQYEPPPNPAKKTDARFRSYVESYGVDDSWELDALEPQVLAALIKEAIFSIRDDDAWEKEVEQELAGRKQLKAAAKSWPRVCRHLKV